MPNGAGALLPPASLHDPRVPELLALLDPEAAFPSPEIALDVAALSALQRLGLRSAAGGCCVEGNSRLWGCLPVVAGGGGGAGGLRACRVFRSMRLHQGLVACVHPIPHAPTPRRAPADLEALVGAARYVEATSDKPGGAGEALARSRVRGRGVQGWRCRAAGLRWLCRRPQLFWQAAPALMG